MVRAEFLRERFFVFAASQRNRFEAHFASVLHAKMPEAANPWTATTSPGRAPELRRALKTVTPAHINGPPSSAGTS